MKNTNKKGFTIVELVIVVAVIAILAAVLIPTFANVISSAHKSADSQLVRNLNTAVATELAANGKAKATTAYEAMQYADTNGYDVSKIVAKSDNKIAWSVDTGAFVLIDTKAGTATYPTTDGSKNIEVAGNEVNYFLVLSSLDDKVDGYSIYAGLDWATATVDIDGVGFDAGANTNITTVNYTNNATGATAKDVVIRTNGGSLTINDTNAASHQYHYGFAKSVNVATGTNCYECHAIIDAMKITAGKAIAADGAYVSVTEASTGVTLKEDGGLFVIPEGTTTSNVAEDVATQIGYTVSDSNISATSDRTSKAASAAEEANKTLNEEIAKNDTYVARIGATGYTTLEAAAKASKDGEVIYVLKDMDNESYVMITYNTIMNFNDHSISNNRNLTTYNASAAIFDIENYYYTGTVYNGNFNSKYGTGIYIGDNYEITLNNCSATNEDADGSKDNYDAAIRITNSAKATIDGGTYSGVSSICLDNIGQGSEATNVSATINGGTFNGELRITTAGQDKKASLTINGGTFNGKFNFINYNKNYISVIINGGTFSNTGLTLEQFKAYLGEGHTATESNGTYTVN